MVVNHARQRQFKKRPAALTVRSKAAMHLRHVGRKPAVVRFVVTFICRRKKFPQRFEFASSRKRPVIAVEVFICFAHSATKMKQIDTFRNGVFY